MTYELLTRFVSAQEAVPADQSALPAGMQAPNAADTGGGPSAGTQQGPTAAQIAQFESEAGAPVITFNQAEIQRPTFEEPGQVPEDVKKLVPAQELIDVECAMTRWKSGTFFAAMDALKKDLLPVIDAARAQGMDMAAPDVEGMKAEGTKRIAAICAAKTVEQAEALVKDFIQWGKDGADQGMNQTRGPMSGQMTAHNDEIKVKVKEQLQPYIDKLSAQMQPDIDARAHEISASVAAQYSGAKSAPDISVVQGQVMGQLQPYIDQKVADMQKKITAKAAEIVAPLKAPFEAIGKLFDGMDAKINADIKIGEAKYATPYRAKALSLRKDLIVRIVDANVGEAVKALDANAAQIENARKANPSLRSAAAMKAELLADANDLKSKLSAALQAEDEYALQSAADAFRKKWQNVQDQAMQSATASAAQMCNAAVPQMATAITQIDQAATQIQSVTDQCTSDPGTAGCDRVQSVADRLATALTKLNDLKTEMTLVTSLCRENGDQTQIAQLLEKIQSDGLDAQAYGEALNAEKQNMLVNSAKTACDQAMPQLDAAKIKMGKDDLVVLKAGLDRCAGKSTNECTAINALQPKYAALTQEVSDFNTAADAARAMCKTNNKETDPNRVSATLGELQDKADQLQADAADLRLEQLQAASARAYCRAVLDSMGQAERDMQAGVDKAEKTLSDCRGKSDVRCSYVNKIETKIYAVRTQAFNSMNKIATIKSQCKTAGADVPPASLTALVDQVRADADALQKTVAALIAEADAAAAKQGKSVWIEAENEARINLLPHTEPWHSNKWVGAASWRPPLYGPGYWYLSRGGEWIEYDVTVPANGAYHVWIRDYVDNNQARGIRRINLMFDGKSYGTFGEVNIPVSSNLGAIGWHEVGSGVTLTAGKHVLRITKEATTAGAAVLDAYYLTTDTDVPPEK